MQRRPPSHGPSSSKFRCWDQVFVTLNVITERRQPAVKAIVVPKPLRIFGRHALAGKRFLHSLDLGELALCLQVATLDCFAGPVKL